VSDENEDLNENYNVNNSVTNVISKKKNVNNVKRQRKPNVK